MSTLTYTITGTQVEFEGFADRLGYMPVVTVDLLEVPNPESKMQFIQRLMKEAQDRLFYSPYVTEIEQTVRNQMEAEKDAIKTDIRNRSTINFVA